MAATREPQHPPVAAPPASHSRARPARAARARGAWQAARAWARGAFGLDPRSLAAFRIGLALLILADLIQRGGDLRAHYTDFGLLPRSPLVGQAMYPLAVCLHLCTGTVLGQGILFLLQGLAACGLLVGFRTRTMAVISWAMMVSLHLRNPLVLQGGDDLLRMLLFWAMFVPLSACVSVDAALASQATLARRGPLPAAPRTGVGPLALLAQIVLMYLTTALLKTGREWHEEGTAVYYALHFDQLALEPAQWLRRYFRATKVLTHLTMWQETFGPALLFSPLAFGPVRSLGIAMLVGMHQIFGAFMLLGLFPWIDTVALVALLPAWFWDRAATALPRAEQAAATLVVGPSAGAARLGAMARSLLVLPYVAVATTPAPAGRGWALVDGAGTHVGYALACRLLRLSPWARGLGWLLAAAPVAALGHRLGRAAGILGAALRRRADGADHLLPWRPLPAPRPSGQALAAAALAVVVIWNVARWPGSAVRVPQEVRPFAYTLRIDQDWGMFAPMPQKEDGWYVMAGERDDGTPIDVWRGTLGPVTWEKPAVVARDFGGQRWCKYLMNIWADRFTEHRLYFGQYLCRRFNGQEARRGPDKLARFEIAFMREMTLPDYVTEPAQKVVKWSHRCFD